MNDDGKQWTEVELPPLNMDKLHQSEPVFSNKASIDLRAVKFILEDAEGNRRVKFHDNEILFLDKTYLLELLPI